MIPDFHDGSLDGLLVSKSQVALFLRTAREEKFMLMLQGVERLHAENFREGSIIFSVDFLTPEQLTPEHISETYGFSANVPSGFVMKDWIAAAKERGLQALEISSSYGCEALVLFKSYALTEGHLI